MADLWSKMGKSSRRPRRGRSIPPLVAMNDYGTVSPCRVTALSMKHLTVDYKLGTAHVPMSVIHEADLAATKVGEWTDLRILRWFLYKAGIPEKEKA